MSAIKASAEKAKSAATPLVPTFTAKDYSIFFTAGEHLMSGVVLVSPKLMIRQVQYAVPSPMAP